MKSSTKIVIVVIVILICIGGIVLLRRNNVATSSNPTSNIKNVTNVEQNNDISDSTADLQMMSRALLDAEQMKKNIDADPNSYDDEAIQEFENAYKELQDFQATHDSAYKLEEQDKIDELTNKLRDAMDKLQ